MPKLSSLFLKPLRSLGRSHAPSRSLKTTSLLAVLLLFGGCKFEASAGKAPTTVGHSSALRQAAVPLDAPDTELSRVARWMNDADWVLIGEASHGTHEFYELRADLTKQLIEQNDLAAVAIEADFSSAWRVNQYVRGRSSDRSAAEALADFERFPVWMWRNTVMAEFVEWLRTYNATRPPAEHVGISGMDVYGPEDSAEAMLEFLAQRDAGQKARAERRIACLLGEGSSPGELMASLSAHPDCVNELGDVARNMEKWAQTPEGWAAWQNALVLEGAARYWLAEVEGSEPSWNVRDRFMAARLEDLQARAASLRGADNGAPIAVWAHNSHLGDARATEMKARGELNLGQLMKEWHGEDQVFSLGFSTHSGTVTAARSWGSPGRQRNVRPSHEESWERLLHEVARNGESPPLPAYALNLKRQDVQRALGKSPRLGRAIGVIYRPSTELQSHYFDSKLAQQFDAIIHLDETSALRPLESSEQWERPAS